MDIPFSELIDYWEEPDEIDATNVRNARTVWSINTKPFHDAHFACVDQYTEILTYEGWKTHNNLTTVDKIATFNISDETIIYQIPSDIYKYNYDGQMIVIENQWISQYITPNHRVLLKYKRGSRKKKILDKEWDYYHANSITPHSGISIPVSGKYNGNIKLDKYKAELIGWIITDGHLRKTPTGHSLTIYQSQTKNPEKVKMIELCLIKSGVTFTKNIRNRIYKSKPYIMINFYMGVKNNSWKWVLEWINEDKTPKWKLLHLDEISLNMMYKSIILGDGNTREDGREQFAQHNEYNRKWFRVLCTHMNKRTTEYNKRGLVNITQKNYANIHTSNFSNNIRTIDYTGIVWCPNIPNSNFVARRRGEDNKWRIFITGNTFPEELVERPVDAGTPRKICTECDKAVKIVYEKVKEDNIIVDMKMIEISCDCEAPFRKGIVLDMFAGSATTLLVADSEDLDWIGIEASEEYAEIARKRMREGRHKVKVPEGMKRNSVRRGF